MKINTNKPYKIYAEVLEPEALAQFELAMQQDCVVQGALMPDAHTGYTLPIGAVIATNNVVFPSYVGYDIGCGMCAYQTHFVKDEVVKRADEIFKGIYEAVPVGFNHNKTDTPWLGEDVIPRTETTDKIFKKNGLKHLGSLGSGNHFIEIGYDTQDRVWIIVHSGSRGIGHAVASHYMRLASGGDKVKEGHYGLAADSQEGFDYLDDLRFCLAFALRNRQEIVARVTDVIEKSCKGRIASDGLFINRNHNHVEFKDGLYIHRKGATHAEDGMLGVIPGNMRDGSFIVRGKGNPDSLYSSSHGAGRVLGRKEAQKTLSMEFFENSMKGIKALVAKETLDESAMAYKNIFEVMLQQSDLVDIITHVKPIINIKG